MKYIILAPGKFHVNSLIADILNYDNNSTILILSSSPNFLKFNNKKIKFYFIPMIFQIIYRKILKIHQPSYLKFIDYVLFDLISSFFIKKNNVLIGFAGVSLISGLKCKKKEGKYILDRACPYYPYQYRTIKNEYIKSKLSPPHINKYLNKRLLNEYCQAQIILVPSNYSSSTYPQHLKKKIRLHKIKINDISISDRSREINNKKYIYGFIGGDYIRKGINLLVDGFSIFLHENDNIQLNIKMNKKEFLKTEKSISFYNNFHNRIKFIGYLSNIGDFYDDIDYLVLPSIDEGFGMVVLESLYSGKPVLISDSVGAKDYVENNIYNLVFKTNDLNAFIFNLSRSLNNIKNNRSSFRLECKKNYDFYIKDQRNFLINDR